MPPRLAALRFADVVHATGYDNVGATVGGDDPLWNFPGANYLVSWLTMGFGW